MATAKLIRFAAHVNGDGMDFGKAARAAGYSDTYIRVNLAEITRRAREAGLLVDPDTIRAAVSDTEDAAARGLAELTQAVPQVLTQLRQIALGAEPAHADQLAAINAVLDRVYGKPTQHAKVDQSTRVAMAPWRDEAADEGDGPPDDAIAVG